jgi:ElaB/YqjD/DUF883 family membrane-anchored ribosome-binding protein
MATTSDRFGATTASIGSKSGSVSGAMESAATSASAAMSNAGEQIADAAGQAQVVAQEQLDKLSASIRRNPIQAAGIAAGAGFLLALLARR